MTSYAFDDCSILHLCKIEINKAFLIYFDKKEFKHDNYQKLELLNAFLDKNSLHKYKFVPNTIQKNILKVVDDMFSGYNVQILGTTFKTLIIDQTEEFYENVKNDFMNISKKEDIVSIKKMFIENVRELRKEKKTPSDDDLKIIAGYKDFYVKDIKYFITEDEHFWGYKDLILKYYNITIVEEWNSDKLID